MAWQPTNKQIKGPDLLSSHSDILSSQLEIVDQATQFLTNLSQSQYTRVMSPHFSSHIGQHMRHALDHYVALEKALKTGIVDYDVRQRDSDIETDRGIALATWHRLRQVLTDLFESGVDTKVTVKTEISSQQQLSVDVDSTLARELIFVASHAIHHFSLMGVIASLQGLEVPDLFGIAPATVSHQRMHAG